MLVIFFSLVKRGSIHVVIDRLNVMDGRIRQNASKYFITGDQRYDRDSVRSDRAVMNMAWTTATDCAYARALLTASSGKQATSINQATSIKLSRDLPLPKCKRTYLDAQFCIKIHLCRVVTKSGCENDSFKNVCACVFCYI